MNGFSLSDDSIKNIQKLLMADNKVTALFDDLKVSPTEFRQFLTDYYDAENPEIARLLLEVKEYELKQTRKRKELLNNQSMTVQHESDYIISDYYNKVRVKNVALITSVAGSVNEKKVRLEGVMERATQEVLFGVSYAEVLLEFEHLRKQIKARINHYMLSMDCELKQHMIIPDLPELQLKHGVNIKEVYECPTQDDRVMVNLEVNLHARIVDLGAERIRVLLDRQMNILDGVKKSLSLCIESELRLKQPEEVFMYFHMSDAERGESVQQALSKAATTMLEGYGMSDFNISFKLMENELTRYLQKLINRINIEGMNSFEVEVVPLVNERNLGGVTFEMEYNLYGVHPGGWFKFQSSALYSDEANLEKRVSVINDTLKRTIREVLSTIPLGVLRYGDYTILKEIQKVVAAKTSEVAAKTYGLGIELINFHRNASIEEQSQYVDARAEVALEAGGSSEQNVEVFERNMLQLQKLWKKRILLLTQDETKAGDKLAETDRKIREVTKLMSYI